MMRHYLANGQEVTVIQKLDDGYLVSCFYDYGSGEDFEDIENIRIVAEVFDAPPVARFAADIVRLKSEIESLRDQRSEMHQRIQEADEMESAAIDRLKRVKTLNRIGNFIDGKITHYAHVSSYGSPKIVEFGNEKDEYRRDSLKLLTLFGKSNGNLEWALNKYSDGSGASYTVMPATSYEEAWQFAQESIKERAAATADSPREDVIKAAREFGVTLGSEYIARFNLARIAVEQKNLEGAEKNLNAIKARIAELNQ